MHAPSPSPPARTLAVALAILRISLGGFLLLWSIEKFVIPERTVSIWQGFYFISIGGAMPYVIGSLEALLSVAIILGLWRKWSYGLGLALHAISTAATWRQLIDPWGIWLNDRIQHLFLAGVPVLAGFVVLYMLREWDTWTIEGKQQAAGSPQVTA